MHAYARVYWNYNGVNFHRDEQLLLLKNNIKKRLPKCIISPKVWFYTVTLRKVRLNPLVCTESERFFEQLLAWNEQKLKIFLEKHSRLLVKQKRHKKVPAYKRPMRL